MTTIWRKSFAAARSAAARSLFVLPLVLLMACGSSGGSSSNGSSGAGGDGDCGQDAPYLTAQPTITPSSGARSTSDTFTVDLTADGNVTITEVLAWLMDAATQSSLATANALTQGSGNDWSGTLTLSSGAGTAGENFLWVALTDGDHIVTQYWLEPTESDTKYFCIQVDANSQSYDAGLSEFDVVTVNLTD